MLLEKVSTAAQQIEQLFSAPASDRRRAEAWFDALLKRAKREGVLSEVATITPAMAELLLDRNPSNRKRSAALVATLATEMREGRWERNGEAVIIADTGELNDGQHRCSASIVSGCSFDTVIVVGVHRASRGTLDQGKKRTNADVVGMYGYSDQNNLAHAARVLFEILNFATVSRTHRASATQAVEIIETHPKLVDSLSFGRRASTGKLGSVGLFAAMHRYCAMRTRESLADEFFEILTTALGFKGKADPIYVLHKRLVEAVRLTESERAAFIIKAFNAWREKDAIRTLRFVAGEDFPTVD